MNRASGAKTFKEPLDRMPIMGAPDRLYEQDFFSWTQEQAKALRDRAESNGSNLPLDWENLAEEIESLGRSLRSSLRSHIRRIIRHLHKLQHSPAIDPRRGWEESVVESRVEIRDLLEDNPSLKREVANFVEQQNAEGLELALDDLERYGEYQAARALRSAATRYTEEQILGPWFPGDPLR